MTADPVDRSTEADARRLQEEIAQGVGPEILTHSFQVYSREKIIGVVENGSFFPAH